VSGAAVRALSRAAIRDFVANALGALRGARALAFDVSELSVAFVDDAAMRRLNRRYRGRDETTDVLTFPADDSYRDPGASGRPLGDIVISIPRARRQAAGQRHSLATELRILLLHGLIHSLGYDHETDQGEMNALEMKIRKKVGL
jgi:probable rRNA maturation factor